MTTKASHDIIADGRGVMHPMNTDTGQCDRHPGDCLSYLLMFGYSDTGIRVS